jgi:hypothetical protein
MSIVHYVRVRGIYVHPLINPPTSKVSRIRVKKIKYELGTPAYDRYYGEIVVNSVINVDISHELKCIPTGIECNMKKILSTGRIGISCCESCTKA